MTTSEEFKAAENAAHKEGNTSLMMGQEGSGMNESSSVPAPAPERGFNSTEIRVSAKHPLGQNQHEQERPLTAQPVLREINSLLVPPPNEPMQATDGASNHSNVEYCGPPLNASHKNDRTRTSTNATTSPSISRKGRVSRHSRTGGSQPGAIQVSPSRSRSPTERRAKVRTGALSSHSRGQASPPRSPPRSPHSPRRDDRHSKRRERLEQREASRSPAGRSPGALAVSGNRGRRSHTKFQNLNSPRQPSPREAAPTLAVSSGTTQMPDAPRLDSDTDQEEEREVAAESNPGPSLPSQRTSTNTGHQRVEMAPPESYSMDLEASSSIQSQAHLSPMDNDHNNVVIGTSSRENHLIEAEIYDEEAKRNELRRQAEQEAEQRFLANAVVAEAKVIPDDDDDDGGCNWKFFSLVCCCLLIVMVAVVTSVVATRDGNDARPLNDVCSRATRLNNFTGGIVEGVILRDVEGSLDDICQVEDGEGYALWYFVDGDDTRLSASTCDRTDLSADSDTQILVFSGSCPDLECVGGSDQLCGSHGGVGWLAEEGTRYFIVVKGFRTSNSGNFTLTLDTLQENDTCESSTEIQAVENDLPLFGSTRNLTFEQPIMSCETEKALAPRSWYRMEGDGSVICASVLSDTSGQPEYFAQLSVLGGSGCSDLQCIGTTLSQTNDPSTTGNLAFLADEGASYFLVVEGMEEAVGDFFLDWYPTPPNGICETASQLDVGESVEATLASACNVEATFCPGTLELDAAGVWYAVEGTGELMIAQISGLNCEQNGVRQSQIIVLGANNANCSRLICIDFETVECTASSELTTSQWFSEPGEQYYLFVQSSDTRTFELTIDEYIPGGSDVCTNATDLFIEINDLESIEVLGTTLGASADNLNGCSNSEAPGVWYNVEGTGNDLVVSTCNEGTNYATDITILGGSCDALECMSSTTITCDGKRAISYFPSVLGESYSIFIHGRNASDTGRFKLSIDEGTLGVANDFCGTAAELRIPSTVFGSTVNATKEDVELCGNMATAPGVWYTFVGQGGTVTASLCQAATNYDTQIYVYRGTNCGELTCIDYNEDSCGTASRVSWDAELNERYFILVSGFNTEVGDFEMVLS